MAGTEDLQDAGGLFAGDGEMRARCRALDWAATPLGPVLGWPPSLRTAAGMILGSAFPSIVLWGPELVQIYNDGYIPIHRAKHPGGLGQPTREVWPEVWHLNAPLFERALRGETVSVVDAPYSLRRDGPDTPPEQTFFTLSISPIPDELGAVGGVLAVAFETTSQVEARRLQSEYEVERSRLAFVFQHAPAFLAVLRGPDHTFDLVNDAYYQLVGHREIIGKPVLDALPEIRGQGFIELLDSVYHTGEPFIGREMSVLLARAPGADPEERFVDLTYMPLVNASGAREGIIAHGTDVTEHVHARQQVERLLAEAVHARADAESANRSKSHFLATMSHELRTPINAIMGYAELLEMGLSGPVTPTQRDQLRRIHASSVHLLGLIEDVLDLAKIEAGRVSVVREPAPVAPVVAAALALVEPQAAARGLHLENHCPADAATAFHGDEDRVRQILANLLSNAVKFTPPSGHVVVSCGIECEPNPGAWPLGAGPWICIHVEDSGVGIDPGKLDAVFQPFVQAEAGHTRTHGGTGLGLSISREYARLMGGDVSAQSTPGKGSRFTVWLPAPPSAAAERPTEARPSPELVPAGKALHAQVDRVVGAYRDRLRADDAVPLAARLSDSEVEDHAASFLADIAQSLVILGETGGQPDLMQDGSDVQRLIAERHGAQRARLGWTEEALRHEFVVMGEEVEAAVRRHDVPEPDLAVGTLAGLLDRACEISVRGFRVAAAGGPRTSDILAQAGQAIDATRRTRAQVQDSAARQDADLRAAEQQAYTNERITGRRN